MRLKLLFFALVLAFAIGWLSSYVYSGIQDAYAVEYPSASTSSRPSPYDRVKESQIHVYDNRVVIDQSNVQWTSYADTHSMEPVLKAGANGLELIPKSEDDIHVGDIVAYEANWTDGLVVHRVIESSKDELGRYYILKGDNNNVTDPGKIRFSEIRYVLIGVIY